MTLKTPTLAAAVAALSLSLFGCGGAGSPAAQTSASVGTAGATLTAGSATLTIPAGALTKDTSVTLRQTEPQHGGKVRIEVEPAELQLEHAAELAVQDDSANVKLKMVDDAGQNHEMEIEDRNHRKFKTSMSKLQAVELEQEDGAACAQACSSTQECDDGICKEHQEDAAKKACDSVCDSGSECDDGLCKAHAEVEVEHGNMTGATTCPPCGTGMECDATDGICKAHKAP